MAQDKLSASTSLVQVPGIGILPAIKKRLRDKKGQNTASACVLPNTEATFRMLLTSGAEFSTATDIGLLQAYVRRGPAHYREPFAHRADIEAGYDNEVLGPLMLEALAIAATGENIRELCQHILELLGKDPERVREYLELGRSYGFTVASNADRLAVGIGTFARAFRAVVDEHEGQAHE